MNTFTSKEFQLNTVAVKWQSDQHTGLVIIYIKQVKRLRPEEVSNEMNTTNKEGGGWSEGREAEGWGHKNAGYLAMLRI